MSREERIRKAAKLKALALDQAGTPEGDLAMERAERVLESLGMSVEDVSVEDVDPLRLDVLGETVTGWRGQLALATSYVCDVVAWSQRGRIRMAGRGVQLEVAQWLYRSLINQCEAAAHVYRKSWEFEAEREQHRTVRKTMNAFRASWSREACRKAIEARKAVGSDGAALVRSTEGVIRRWLAKEHGIALRRQQGRSRTSAAGLAAGKGARFGSGMKGGASRGTVGAGRRMIGG